MRVLVLTAILAAFCVPVLGETPAGKTETEETPKHLLFEEIDSLSRMENDGTGYTRVRTRTKILTEFGRQEMAQIYFPFRAEQNRVEIDHVWTVKPDGTRIEASLDNVLEVTAPVAQTAPSFSDLKYKVVPVPALNVGDTIDYELTTFLDNPIEPGEFWSIYWRTVRFDVGLEAVTLDLPASRDVALATDKSIEMEKSAEDGRVRYVWRIEGNTADYEVTPEPLYVLSSMIDWKQFGSWYRGLVEERSEITPAIRELALGLVDGIDDPRERVAAVYRHVSQTINYVSISFGLGGYQPHAAAETLQNQYGDCKDKHTLLATLLAAIDVEAFPALINTHRDTGPLAPTPMEFDHVITAVPIDGELLWLDTTLELAPPGWLSRAHRGKTVLLVRGEEEELVETPAVLAIPDRNAARLIGKIDGAGRLEADLVFEQQGEFELIWRETFRRSEPELLEWGMKMLLPADLWGAEVEAPTSSDPLDVSIPFTFETAVTKGGFVAPYEPISRINVPSAVLRQAPWEAWIEDEIPEDREELNLGGRTTLEDTVELVFPPEFKVELPEPTKFDRSFARFESSYAVDDSRLTVHRLVEVKQDKVPVGKADEVRELIDAILADLDRFLLFERVGEFDARAHAEGMSADELNMTGWDAYSNGRIDDSLWMFELATGKDPEHGFAWNNLGLALKARGDLSEAEAAFRKQIEISPDDIFAHNNLGEVHRLRGEFEAAIKAYRKQIEVSPQDMFAHANLARTLAKLERWDEAVKAYREALSVQPMYSGLYVGLGRAQLSVGDAEGARESFSRAIELDGEAGTYNDIAYEMAEAGHDLERAIRYANSSVSRSLSAFLLIEGLEGWQRQVRTQTHLGYALDTLGWISYKQEKYDDAIEQLEAALELSSSSVAASHLAVVETRRENLDAALRHHAVAQHLWEAATDKSDPKPELPAELAGLPELGSRLAALAREVARSFKMQPAEGAWSCPNPTEEFPEVVMVVCLVNGEGRPSECEDVAGKDPWKAAAVEDAPRLRFPAVRAQGQAVHSLRLLTFAYDPGCNVTVERRSYQPQSFEVIMTEPVSSGVPVGFDLPER